MVGAIAALIFVFLFWESRHAITHIGVTRFFIDASWHPSSSANEGTFYLVPMVLASLFAVIGAVGLAAPMGIVSAVFMHFYAPAFLATPYRRLIEILSGIPSVIFGFWGLMVLVPLIVRWQAPGTSLLAGTIVLALMVLPTMALIADSAFTTATHNHLHGATALGLSRWCIIRTVFLPITRRSLLTAGVLQCGRAIGETMAVMMVCGNVVKTPTSLFAPVRTLTANIALEMSYAMEDHRAALFFSGSVLLLLVSVLVWFAAFIDQRELHG